MSSKISITIDGRSVEVAPGSSIMDAARAGGIYIPHLCHHPDLSPVGACRLCIVDVEGRGVVTSCNTQVAEGMVVRTDTPELNRMRRVLVELLIANHEGECLQCQANLNCELQRVASFVGVEEELLKKLRRPELRRPVDESNPFFIRDMGKCILCGICVRTCEEIQGASAIDFAYRGLNTTIATFGNKPLAESVCESCGECMARCPVGALAPKKWQRPAYEVLTICPYCGCGCGLYLGVREGRIVSARGDRANPASAGALCVKGRFGFGFVNSPERLKRPLIRKDGKLVEASWDEALALVAERLRRYKPDELAVISSAKITNEDNYAVQKFARAVLGTNHIDHCARLCHAPSVAGLAQSFGSGAMTNSIQELSDARCIVAIGSNTTEAHPIVGQQVRKAARRGASIIVIDPRRTDLARAATLHLQNCPGSDVPVLMGMARIILEEGLYDADFIERRCDGFAAFKESLGWYDLSTVERLSCVPKDKLIKAARIYATQKPGSIIYAMGITQHTHGTDNVLAVSNLALLTGNVGRPSSGVNPLRGQNNVQGACDMGALPNVFPGYQKVGDPEAQAKFERAWGVKLNDRPGLTHLEIFEEALKGRIKALYLVGENPALSEADASHARKAMEALEFLVVQDIFLTETAEFAHVVLPAASFAEKDGTFTNTERRVQRVRRVIPPVGESKPDWQIVSELARRMGAKGFDWQGPSEIMREIASLTPSYAGISYERLERQGIQWPCPAPDHPGTRFLHAERFATPSGKANFKPISYRPPAELPDADYPLILTTARSLYHFHTSTMTGKVEGLIALHGCELLEINPSDAQRLGVHSGDRLIVSSRRGRVEAIACLSEDVPAGVVSMTFHFPQTPTNLLTNAALDPVAKIPETKVCAVRVAKAEALQGSASK